MTMVLITALTSGLSGNLFSYVLGANAQSADTTSPEAMLTVEYPAGTLLSTAITGIKSQLPNKNLNGITIANISNKLDFEGKNQTFSKSNEENKNSTDFVNGFKRSQTAFLKTLVGFKSADDKKQNYENKNAIAPLVKKYSAETIQKTQTKYSKNPTTITGLTVTGSLVNMNKIKNSIGKDLKVSVIDLVKMQNLATATKSKINTTNPTEADLKAVNEEANKIIKSILDQNPDLKSQIPTSQPDLSGISESQGKIIESLTKKDISGNYFVDSAEIQKKTGLTSQSVQEVQKSIAENNKLPEEIKDGTLESTKNTTTTNTAKEVEKNEASTLEKVATWVSEFGTINAYAQDWTGGNNYAIRASQANTWYAGNYLDKKYTLWISRAVMDRTLGYGINAVSGIITATLRGACSFLGFFAPACWFAIGFVVDYFINVLASSVKNMIGWCRSGLAMDVYTNSRYYINIRSIYCSN